MELLPLSELDNSELNALRLTVNSSMLKMRIMGYNALNKMYRDMWRVAMDIDAEIQRRINGINHPISREDW